MDDEHTPENDELFEDWERGGEPLSDDDEGSNGREDEPNEDADAEKAEETSDEEEDAEASEPRQPLNLARDYTETPIHQREQAWAAYSDEERETLQGLGVSGPASGLDPEPEEGQEPAPAFEPLKPGSPGFANVSYRAELVAKGALKRANRGDLDLDTETREHVEGLLAKAEALPTDRGGGEEFQRAAHVLAVAEQRALEANPQYAFGHPDRRRQRMQADGSLVTEEGDSRGSWREVSRLSAEEVAEAQQERAALEAPWQVPARASLQDVSNWTMDQKVKFREEHPEEWQALLAGASDQLDGR